MDGAPVLQTGGSGFESHLLNAEWSSLEARLAHTQEVVGSNPTSAITGSLPVGRAVATVEARGHTQGGMVEICVGSVVARGSLPNCYTGVRFPLDALRCVPMSQGGDGGSKPLWRGSIPRGRVMGPWCSRRHTGLKPQKTWFNSTGSHLNLTTTGTLVRYTAPWCNGSTLGSEPSDPGSSPGGATSRFSSPFHRVGTEVGRKTAGPLASASPQIQALSLV